MHKHRTTTTTTTAPSVAPAVESAAAISREVGEWFAEHYPERTDFARRRYVLLQPGNSQTKLKKNTSFRTFGLAMPPAKLWIGPHVGDVSHCHVEGWRYLGNVCPWEDGCAESCIASTGHYGMGQSAARTWVRVLWHQNRGLFLRLLSAELAAIDRAMLRVSRRRHRRLTASVRLNVTSDVQWWRYVNMAQYSRIMFYDYTKNPDAEPVAANHDVSVSVTRRYSVADIRRLARTGRRPVVVVPTAEDAAAPTFAGIPAVNGDNTDERFRDPRDVVVLLRIKLSTDGTELGAIYRGGMVRSPRTGRILSAPAGRG